MATGALAACPAPAWGFETILQDNANVLQGPDSAVAATMQKIAALGVDRVRITVAWSDVAPAPSSANRPAGFDAADPEAYAPRADYFGRPIWLVDRAVLAASLQGLKVDLNLAAGAPRWAAAGRGAGGHLGSVLRPNPQEFATFGKAMARRYSGKFSTPLSDRPLPRVDVFELWNEPNVPVFLQPQFSRGTPVAADIYRALVQAAYPAIKSAQPDATVLVGATAATGFQAGRAYSPIGPLRFLRRLACVDARLRPVRTGACRKFRRVPGDGFSQHPYVLKSRPGTVSKNPEDVRIGTLNRLTSLLRKLVARRRISRGLANLWITEFGYEANDPVRNKPWSLSQQARFLAEAEYLAQRVRGLRSFAQFLLRDVNTEAALSAAARGQRERPLGSWQTGLFFENGDPKPSAMSFRLTLVPFPAAGRGASFYGHVRPARSSVRARIQQLAADGTWKEIATRPTRRGSDTQEFSTRGDGTFIRTLTGRVAANASFRLVWLQPSGQWEAGPPSNLQPL